jgi:hypothetical protein
MEEMRFRHQRDGGHIPGRLVLLLTGNLLNGVTTFAGRFVGFYAGVVRSVVGNGHRSTATWLHTS